MAGGYYFYEYDIRGSVTAIVAPDGTLAKGYQYDEFGNLSETGEASFKNEVTFTSSVTDNSTGLQYMNARYYNPSTGRFLTQDSYSGNAYEPWTQHLYSYCGNNPTNMVDPTGHYAGMTVNEYSKIKSGAHKFKPLIDPYIKKVVSNATNPTGKVLEVVDEYTSELWDEVQDDPSATNIVKWATVGGIDLDRMFKQENPLCFDHWVANIQGFLFVYMFYQAGANAVATNTATNAMMTSGKGRVIVGETMKRVETAAEMYPDAKILNDMPEYWNMGLKDYEVTSKMMQYNRKWILEQLRSGREIIDIGLDANRITPSIFYEMEQNMIKNYRILHP